MKFSLQDTISILERTPSTVRNTLEGLPDNWVKQNEGPDTWSPFDVVGHLIHGEKTDWIPRTKIVLFEDDKHFTPYDRFAQFKESVGKTMADLLGEFESLRARNIEELIDLNLQESDFDKTGIHPEFGPVTIRQLLAAWTVHDLGHIVQINRVLAKQYRQEAGPWPKYLAVLNS
ncbi:MAG: DinB family protein [Cyclobacteriaceae bacterium]